MDFNEDKVMSFFLDVTKTGIGIIDADYNIRFVNEVWKKNYGNPKGKKCYEYFMGRSEKCPDCGITKALQTKKTIVTREVLAKEGNRPVEVTTIPFQDEKGEWLVAEISVDISERLKSEKALTISQSRNKTLIENLPQKIFLKDRQSVYISCNENYARDLNTSPEDITGKTDYDFYPKELADKYREDDRRLMKAAKVEDIEEKYIQNGKEVWVHTSKAPVKDEHGKVIGILGIFWDISKRKKAEEESRKRLHELEIIHKTTIGREIKMIELKREVNVLLKELGKPPKYKG